MLEEMPLDDIYKGMAECLITGFSVGEVMWKKTKRGVIPFDIRMRDQRRFVFQEDENSLYSYFSNYLIPPNLILINYLWIRLFLPF